MIKILVVDDEANIRHLLGTVLRRKGYEVLLADCGSKAVELYRQERPHVAILDLIMPGMSGIAVLEQLRALDSHFPIIILTGMSSEETERRARELGVTDFLHKGFSLHEVGQALAAVLKQGEVPR